MNELPRISAEEGVASLPVGDALLAAFGEQRQEAISSALHIVTGAQLVNTRVKGRPGATVLIDHDEISMRAELITPAGHFKLDSNGQAEKQGPMPHFEWKPAMPYHLRRLRRALGAMSVAS